MAQSLLEGLVTPEPVVLPDLGKAELLQALIDWREIVHDMLASIVIRLHIETAKKESPRPQRFREFVDRSDRIDEVLKVVHSGHKIKGFAWEGTRFEIHKLGRQPSEAETPRAEAQHGRTYVRQGDLEIMAGEENPA
jgi:hypothetical protein